MKEVILKYSGSDAEIDFAVTALAKRAGWVLLTQEEINNGQVQATQESMALDYVTNFIRESVKVEVMKQVSDTIEQQAIEARDSALAQATDGLDLITKSLEINTVE